MPVKRKAAKRSAAKLPAKVRAKLSPAKRKQIAAHQAKRKAARRGNPPKIHLTRYGKSVCGRKGPGTGDAIKWNTRPALKCQACMKRLHAMAEKTAKAAIKNPKRAGKRPRRRNGIEGAAALYEKFHQAPAKKVTTKLVATHRHSALADLGRLAELFVRVDRGDTRKLIFAESGSGVVRLAASEDGGQLYFIGGDQAIDLGRLGLAATLPKDHVIVGEASGIAYETAKGFDGHKPAIYVHKFGEGGKPRPALGYDVRNKRLYLVGGAYQVKREGIVH
ncbi:MAG: hypothetical protein CUN53_00145 [Phototrophicales bacterium]|nr:MAG: hypothetical protein CUN53_00145 [Phototrophicales bacterium]